MITVSYHNYHKYYVDSSYGLLDDDRNNINRSNINNQNKNDEAVVKDTALPKPVGPVIP